jgi:hypothetical protein
MRLDEGTPLTLNLLRTAGRRPPLILDDGAVKPVRRSCTIMPKPGKPAFKSARYFFTSAGQRKISWGRREAVCG